MTSGYSGTALAKKLGIKEGLTVFVQNAPANYKELLAPLPAGVRFLDEPSPDTDLIHLFVNSRAELLQRLDEFRKRIRKDGAIWVSWYKKAAKLPTEITEDSIRDAALPLGLVDVKVCAVDEKWSGLKLVIRRENRV